MDHDYNDVAVFLGIDPEPQTPPLLEAAETRDPLNINAQFQAQPPPQQSSSSFAAGVIQNLHNLDQSLESRNTVFTPYQSSSQFGSNEPMIGSSHETRNMNAQLQSQIEKANVHSSVRCWPYASSSAADSNQQQLSSNQPIWQQNQFNMGYFHPGSASYSTAVQPSSLPVAANQHTSSSSHHELATSHVSPFEQHPSIIQPFATQEEANAHREEAKRRYSLRKLMMPKSNKYKSRSDGAKKKKRNKGRFVKKGEDYDYDPSQQGL